VRYKERGERLGIAERARFIFAKISSIMREVLVSSRNLKYVRRRGFPFYPRIAKRHYHPRYIFSIRLDLRRLMSSYLDYCHHSRTHLSLDKDCPDSRPIMPRRIGRVVAIPQVNGLHHRYERLAA